MSGGCGTRKEHGRRWCAGRGEKEFRRDGNRSAAGVTQIERRRAVVCASIAGGSVGEC